MIKHLIRSNIGFGIVIFSSQIKQYTHPARKAGGRSLTHWLHSPDSQEAERRQEVEPGYESSRPTQGPIFSRAAPPPQVPPPSPTRTPSEDPGEPNRRT